LGNLSAVAGEEKDTLEDTHEPFLIQTGFNKRTQRERVATGVTCRHLRIPKNGGRVPRQEKIILNKKVCESCHGSHDLTYIQVFSP
jgi:hypothetical protein